MIESCWAGEPGKEISMNEKFFMNSSFFKKIFCGLQ